MSKLLLVFAVGALMLAASSFAVSTGVASADGGGSHHDDHHSDCRDGHDRGHDCHGSEFHYHMMNYRPTVFVVPFSSAYSPAYSAGYTNYSTNYSNSAYGTTSLNMVQGGPLGAVLVDDKGFTLYAFAPDSQSSPTCYGACSQTWPAVMPVSGTYSAAAGVGVQATMIGYVTRSDGTVQLTYNHWPLYRYAGDNQPGQANGQGLNSFGGLWHVGQGPS